MSVKVTSSRIASLDTQTDVALARIDTKEGKHCILMVHPDPVTQANDIFYEWGMVPGTEQPFFVTLGTRSKPGIEDIVAAALAEAGSPNPAAACRAAMQRRQSFAGQCLGGEDSVVTRNRKMFDELLSKLSKMRVVARVGISAPGHPEAVGVLHPFAQSSLSDVKAVLWRNGGAVSGSQFFLKIIHGGEASMRLLKLFKLAVAESDAVAACHTAR